MKVAVRLAEQDTLDTMHIKPKHVQDYAVLRAWLDLQGDGWTTIERADEKSRSSPHHRKFFGVIAAAFNQWPEHEEFQPENEDDLRQWLEVKAGHRKHQDFPITEENAAQVADMMVHFAAAIDGKKVFPRFGRGVVRLYWADSISWSKLNQKEFNAVSRPVFEIIEASIGVPVDQLTRENARAA